MLTLASLTKTAKEYALVRSISNEEFLNALVEPLVVAGNVKARGGEPFALDKSRASKILNGRCDVPMNLRGAISRLGIEGKTADGFKLFLEDHIDTDHLDALFGDILDLARGSGGAADRMEAAVADPQRFMALALLEAVKNDNRESTVLTVWNNGTGSLRIEVGDLLSHGFGKPRTVRQIIVIPVDTSFETEVSWGYEDVPAPLVSPKSIHGKWLCQMNSAGIDGGELSDRIESSLRRRAIEPLPVEKPSSGRRRKYPIGTVAIIPNAHSVFYLLAIADFDERNNAHASKDDIAFALRSLIEEYDANGQCLDIFIPLMGTGSSRANLTHQESLDLIVGEITKNKRLVHGNVTVVVYKDDVKKLDVERKKA